MVRAVVGLLLGLVVFTAGAVAYGWNLHAFEVEPILLGAAGVGAVIGCVTAVATRKRQA